jgi:alpha-beta hydrolase superfamily lysophospholipase
MPATDTPGIFLPAGDGTLLFFNESPPLNNVKGCVLLTHGMGEHSARYAHVAAYFLEHGYRFCAYDLRGHGRSRGRRGHINSYEELLGDLHRVATHCRREGEPLFLYGHSLGAQITLNYLIHRNPEIHGAIITAPWLRLVYRPHPGKVLLAKLLAGVWPGFTQDGPNDNTLLSRDIAFLDSLPGAEMLHHKISARMYLELMRGACDANEMAPGSGARLLLIHGGSDPVTSREATESFFRRSVSGDKTLRIYPGMLHEPHNEIGREAVFSEMVEWMDARCCAA